MSTVITCLILPLMACLPSLSYFLYIDSCDSLPNKLLSIKYLFLGSTFEDTYIKTMPIQNVIFPSIAKAHNHLKFSPQ